MKDWRDQQIERADEAMAKPFRSNMKAAYRQCRNAADLHRLSRECWKTRDDAVRQANKVNNFTKHGTHKYDMWSMLADDAESMAKQFYRKAKAIEAGEPIDKVLPFLATAA
jgi:hypothetical protein